MRPNQTAVPVRIPADGISLDGDLLMPRNPRGLVIFAHGSGSSRYSPRNRFVADSLNEAGLATLLLDLLTAAEEQVDARTAHLRFDIQFLANRLQCAITWATGEDLVASLTIGIFGASTGAAAALAAAAESRNVIGAVVSRGGRPDLAAAFLARVSAPTLLIVGGRDDFVFKLNEAAFEHLRCEKRLEVIPGATHLFEEPGTIDRVAKLARDWFLLHIPPETRRSYRSQAPAADARKVAGTMGAAPENHERPGPRAT